MSKTAVAVLLILMAALAGQQAVAGAGSTDAPGEALLREVDRRLQPESYEAYRKLINIEPDGRRKEFVLFSLKKGRDKVVALFLEPASEKGRATLRLGDNMWLYIPNVGKPIRITSLQSVTGGIFNNSDILSLDYSVEYTVAAQSTDKGRTVLDLKAKSKSVAYDQLRMWVDPQSKLPTKIECRASTGMLIKTLRFKDVKDFGGGTIRPAMVETESPLHKGYRSVMVFGKITPRELKDEVFTLNFLARVDSLR
jgi:outer membrane lipoprotein-sorting protein